MDALVDVIADPRRRAILRTFAGRRASALTVDEVAAEHGLHRSVAFAHLERLADASLLVRGTRGGYRGRPARTYTFAGRAAETSHPRRGYRLLSEILAAGLAGAGEQAQTLVRERGGAHGRELAAGRSTAQEAVEALGALGGEYQLADMELVSRNCIFREACDTSFEVVCGVHAGIIEGALEAAGACLKVTPIGPDDSGGCAFRLEAHRS